MLASRYAEFIGKEIQTAYLGVVFASTARTSSIATSPTPTSGSRTRSTATPTPARVFDRAALNAELEKIEKPAGISNPKDFRNEIVNFVLRARASNAGKNPRGPATRSCAW